MASFLETLAPYVDDFAIKIESGPSWAAHDSFEKPDRRNSNRHSLRIILKITSAKQTYTLWQSISN